MRKAMKSFLASLFNSWYNLLNEEKLPLMHTSTIYSKMLSTS